MNEQDKQETIRRYNERLMKYGYSEKTLGWSRNKNNIRFNALVREWLTELESSEIADFGCGFGDLYRFLKEDISLKKFRYTGIDINAKLVEIGRSYYPQANFWIGDIIKENFQTKFDFIFSSGVFNHQLINHSEYFFIEETLNKLNELTLKGLAVNFLSDKVDFKLEHTFHSNPGKILDIAYNFSRNIILRNDYMPFEFTIYIRKDIAVDSEKVVFENYLE
ncbi:MAG: class I SAM-dependent methyltransferase [Lewinellaceae bacterium]|nr:class I SAM-dependent methyltransferase [Lewinellaceae bacterium]